jgi:aminoglycoside/choline kinase family phosphotransferase
MDSLYDLSDHTSYPSRGQAPEIYATRLKDISPSNHSAYRLGATILGAGRHLKVIGVFTRFALKRKRKDYLQHLPRLWKYLLKAFKQPALEPAYKWFESYLPLSKQSIPNL